MTDRLQQLAQTHYENFPVGSRFIPSRYRPAVHLVYAFARVADDIADEGTMDAAERVRKLTAWESLLLEAVNGSGSDEFFSGLASVIRQYQIPVRHFCDLISAFKQDASSPLYESFDEISDYCRRSANPVGRIMLKIFGSSDPVTEQLSDKICTALQLANFLQDISVDTRRNRFYISTKEMDEFGLVYPDLAGTGKQEAVNRLMRSQVERASVLFEQGKEIFNLVHRDLRFELKLIWHGGMRILEKIAAQGYDTRHARPAVTTFDTICIVLRAMR
jgi:squalene synthase HpnC